MTRPVFFSMGGHQDAEFAKKVKDLLPDAMVYFYQRTGEEGIEFRAEIEREIQNCRLFVVFWSEDYLRSDHAKWELAHVRRLIESGNLDDKHLLVVPMKRTGPNIQSKWTNPLNSALKNEFVLGKWRLERALDPAPDAPKVAEFIRRKLEDTKVTEKVLISRPSVLEDIRSTVSQPNFQAREFVFITGYEGDGRRTALRQYMKSSYGNLTERQIAIDTTEGPEDLLLRMMDSCGMSTLLRGEVMSAINEGSTTSIKELRKVIHSGRESKSYFVITLDKFPALDGVGIPRWVQEVFAHYGSGVAPLVFFVTSNPVTDAQLAYYPKAGRVRVPGLDDSEMAELVYRLSVEDRDRDRWTERERQIVLDASGSSPSLCHTIMFALLGEPTLSFLDVIVKREADNFSSSMSPLLGYILEKFKGSPTDILALRIIERLGLTSKQALNEIMAPLTDHAPYDLYRLLEHGLIERLSDDVFRIPPLIQRRLGYILWGSTEDAQLNNLFEGFGQRMLVATDEYGSVYASNKLATSLRTSGQGISSLDHYLTIASLFKVGMDRYLNGEYELAHSVLKRSMNKLLSRPSVDLGTQVEIARYFGLAAARVEAFEDVESTCDFLETLSSSYRAQSAKAMAAFLRGFKNRVERHWGDSIPYFEEAKVLLNNVRHAERQRGAILTELSRAYIRRSPPDYERAVAAAQEAFDEKNVVHNLSGLIRARIYRTLSSKYSGDAVFDAEIRDIRVLINDLSAICKSTGQEFDLVRESDLERAIAFRRHLRLGVPLDFSKSIALLDKASRIKSRDQTRMDGWKLKLTDQSKDYTTELIEQTEKMLQDKKRYRKNHLEDAVKICVLATAKKNRERAKGILQRNRELLLDGAVRHLEAMITGSGAIKLTITSFLDLDRL